MLSRDNDARMTLPSASQRRIERVVPETSGTKEKTPLVEEAVCPSTKSDIGKNVGPEQEQPPSDVATLPAIVPQDISSQATRRGSAIRSSSATARRARRASPYDVEDMRLHLVDTSIDASTVNFPWIRIRLRSPSTSSMDYAQVGQEPTMSHSSLGRRSTGDDFEKEPPVVLPHLALYTAVQKSTDLEEALRRRCGDRYPKAGKVFSSEGKLLDMDTHGISPETKRNSLNSTLKF